jgi:hypothetical protein
VNDDRQSIHPARCDKPSAAHPRVDVLGVRVSAVDMERMPDLIAGWIERREPSYVCVTPST